MIPFDPLLYGLTLILAADYLQILEEWKTRGLTDTSVKVLLMLIAGPALIAYHWQHREPVWIFYGFTGSAGIAGCLLFLKLRDFLVTKFKLFR